jgi:HK97 family phage major capsid protein
MTYTLNRARRRALARRYGVDPADLGRIVNRATAGSTRTGGTGTVNPDDVDRITIPDTPAALEAMLADSATMQKVFANKAAFGELISKYAKTVLDKDQEIATQVRTETQRVLAEWLKENADEGIRRVNLAPDVLDGPMSSRALARQKAGIYNPRAMGAKIDNEFDGSADYLRAIWHNTSRDAPLQAKLQRVRNAFSTTVPSEGGYLLPETLRAQLLEIALETSIVRPRAMVIPMETMRVPIPMVDSTSNVDSVFGGIVAYWTEEGAALQESSASFGRVVLDSKKLTALTHVPNELISDSPISFQAFIDRKFPQALAFYEDDAFMNGSGAGEPHGFLNSPAAISITAESGQPADTIVWENLVKMYARMLPSSHGRAVWVASHDTFPELATMALSVGTGGSAIWLNNGQEGPPMTILGRPVLFTEKCPALGGAGDINYVDLDYYLVGDRQVMSAMSTPHYRFGNDQTSYRIIQRVDGRPWIQSAITPKNGGATLSPFVKIAAR